MTMTLYGIAASRSARPLWLLEEMGADYTHVAQTYKGGATREPDFLRLNPNGHIPVLDDDGILVWESMAITLYLAHKLGGLLAPASHAETAETLRWTFWSVTECEKDALLILFQRVAGPPAQRDAHKLAQAEKRLAVPLSVLNSHLADRDYIAAERFTVADVNVASIIAWAKPASALLQGFEHVERWLTRCLQRPAQLRVREMARRDQAPQPAPGA